MRLGLIINPIAGMGGRVGLKGTDNVLKEAISRGAEPIAPKRAIEFLQKLNENREEVKVQILTCPGNMGETEAQAAAFRVQILPMRLDEKTTAEDTKIAVRLLIAADVDLILFVGGDGTAKDIFDAMQGCDSTPVLGVPSGVKMYSGIFSINPTDAADVVLAFARNQAQVTEFEIVDADETAIRSDTFAIKLHGFLKAPFLPAHVQGSKQISPETDDETENQSAIARFIIEEVPSDATWLLGPGTTVKRVAEILGTCKTVLGVDIYKEGKTILDVNEKTILKKVQDWKNTWMILSPIGHQGILLGRGNQQLSPQIIKKVGKERIIVAATKSKLQNIEGNILRIDTDDEETNNMMKGYIKVVTDYREWRLMPVR